MSLSIGELSGYLLLDDSKFEKGLTGARKSFSKFGSFMKDHGKEMGVAAGAALALGFGTGAAQQQANANLAARLGLSGAQAKKVGRVAGDLWRSGFGESMDDAAAGVQAVMQQLGKQAGDKGFFFGLGHEVKVRNGWMF